MAFPRVHIRETRVSDLPEALELNNSNVPAVNHLDTAALEWLVAAADVALSAEVGGAFAGFCIVLAPGADYASLNYAWFSRHYDDFAYLDRIVVDPSHRRGGIGRGFYADLVQRLSSRYPVLTCEVNVRPLNAASLEFHRTIGFREVGRQDTDGGAKTVSLLELPLVAAPSR